MTRSTTITKQPGARHLHLDPYHIHVFLVLPGRKSGTRSATPTATSFAFSPRVRARTQQPRASRVQHNVLRFVPESPAGQDSRGRAGYCTVGRCRALRRDARETLIAARYACKAVRLGNAFTRRVIDLVVQLDCLHVLNPLGRFVRLWRNRMTIRHRCAHSQTFEGSTSRSFLVGVCPQPSWLGDHITLPAMFGVASDMFLRHDLVSACQRNIHTRGCEV